MFRCARHLDPKGSSGDEVARIKEKTPTVRDNIWIGLDGGRSMSIAPLVGMLRPSWMPAALAKGSPDGPTVLHDIVCGSITTDETRTGSRMARPERRSRRDLVRRGTRRSGQRRSGSCCGPGGPSRRRRRAHADAAQINRDNRRISPTVTLADHRPAADAVNLVTPVVLFDALLLSLVVRCYPWLPPVRRVHIRR